MLSYSSSITLDAGLDSLARFFPVSALWYMQGERVLDMSAAPGGKSTYIAQLMRNTGVVIANDLRPQVSIVTVLTLCSQCPFPLLRRLLLAAMDVFSPYAVHQERSQ